MKAATRAGLIGGAVVAAGIGLGVLTEGQGAPVRCAWVDSRDSSIVVFQDFAKACPPDRLHKNIKWLPAPKADLPSFNPATQVRAGPTYTVGSKAVTEAYTVRAKTAQELDAEKDALVARNESDKLIFEVLFDMANRIRALESKSAITRAQFRAHLKGLL